MTLISPYVYPGLPKELTTQSLCDKITEVVANHFNLEGSWLTANTRNRAICLARQISMWILRNKGLSYSEIGRYFYRDHSTVMYTINTLNNQKEVDKDFADTMNQVQLKVSNFRSPSQNVTN